MTSMPFTNYLLFYGSSGSAAACDLSKFPLFKNTLLLSYTSINLKKKTSTRDKILNKMASIIDQFSKIYSSDTAGANILKVDIDY